MKPRVCAPRTTLGRPARAAHPRAAEPVDQEVVADVGPAEVVRVVAVHAADQRRDVGPRVVVARCRVVDVHLLDGAAVVGATVAPALVGTPLRAVEQRRRGAPRRLAARAVSGPGVRDHVRVGLQLAGVDQLEREPLAGAGRGRRTWIPSDGPTQSSSVPRTPFPSPLVALGRSVSGASFRQGDQWPSARLRIRSAGSVVAAPRQRHHPVGRRAQPRAYGTFGCRRRATVQQARGGTTRSGRPSPAHRPVVPDRVQAPALGCGTASAGTAPAAGTMTASDEQLGETDDAGGSWESRRTQVRPR